MRYVIMANGRGTRWGQHLGLPKHLIEFDGETLLHRAVRQLREQDPSSDVVISASNPSYETEGARRHAPERNELEIDRFAPELIEGDVAFLYGDTLYSDPAIERIVGTPLDGMDFFGDESGIVAVRTSKPGEMRAHLERVRRLFLDGEIDSCVGWQLYQSYADLPFDEKVVGPFFHRTTGQAVGFNTPADLDAFERWYADASPDEGHRGFARR